MSVAVFVRLGSSLSTFGSGRIGAPLSVVAGSLLGVAMSVAAFAQIASTASVFGAVLAPATYLWLVGFHLEALF